MHKSILITGASGEFGQLMVKALLKRGHKVVAAMRNIQEKNSNIAKELQKDGAYIVEIDLVDEQSVIRGVDLAIQHVGILDILINNAGVGAYGLQETFTACDWKKIFDVNVFGVQRINRAVLPHMRDKNSGLLIHISSLIGRITLPFWGAYGASKWAVEAMAESYRVELSGLGIDSCIIEPGPFYTSFFENLISSSDVERDKSYGDYSKTVKESFINFGKILSSNQEQKPGNIIDALIVLIDTEEGKRSFRTVVDNMGIGKYISPYNDQLEKITFNIYKDFAMSDMLNLNVYNK